MIEREGNRGVLALALTTNSALGAGDQFRALLCLEVVLNPAFMTVGCKNHNRIVLI